MQQQAVLPAEGLSGVVCGLAQVRRTSIGTELRPQRVDDAITRQTLPRRQAQQLHQLGGAQAGPALGREIGAVDRHREAAQQPDLEAADGLEFIDGLWIWHGRPSLRSATHQRNHRGDPGTFQEHRIAMLHFSGLLKTPLNSTGVIHDDATNNG